MTNEQFESIASKLEPPRENETVLKIDGSSINSDQIKKAIKDFLK